MNRVERMLSRSIQCTAFSLSICKYSASVQSKGCCFFVTINVKTTIKMIEFCDLFFDIIGVITDIP